MTTLRDAAEAALKADPTAFIRYELADFRAGRKGEYLAVFSGAGRELFQIDRETSDQLARAGMVRAGPFDQEAQTYHFRQAEADG